jgi:hypothetical protein
MADPSAGPEMPSLVLGLVNLSPRMIQPRGEGLPTRLRSARWLLDRVVESACRRYGGPSQPTPDLGVALIGYRTGPDGGTEFRSLLPGTRGDGREWVQANGILNPPPQQATAWVGASRLAERPVRSRRAGPRHWTEVDAVHAGGGDASASEALRLAHRLVSYWLLHSESGCAPPLVIHCGDDRPPDAATALLTRSLRALTTTWGPVGVVHCLFGDDFPRSDGAGPPHDQLRDLWEASSPLPGRDRSAGAFPRRGTTVQHRPVRAIGRLLRSIEPAGSHPPDCERPPHVRRFRVLVTAKDGPIEECEDAHCTEPASGRFAVTDGAGEGFNVKNWARITARGFIERRPDLEDPASLADWVQENRLAWKQTFDIHALRAGQLERLQRYGGATTFVGLSVYPASSEDGSIRWRAWAIGDSCLFLVRDRRLQLCFPIADPDAFAGAPVTLRTRIVRDPHTGKDVPPPRPRIAQGRCLPGDILAIATDAVSQWIVATTLRGDPIDWDAFWSWDDAEWADRVQKLRQARAMKIDDSTLLLIEIGAPTPPAPVERQPEEGTAPEGSLEAIAEDAAVAVETTAESEATTTEPEPTQDPEPTYPVGRNGPFPIAVALGRRLLAVAQSILPFAPSR